MINRYRIGKVKHGIKGLRCPCCNSMGCHPRNMKPKSRRILRGILKRVDKADREQA